MELVAIALDGTSRCAAIEFEIGGVLNYEHMSTSSATTQVTSAMESAHSVSRIPSTIDNTIQSYRDSSASGKSNPGGHSEISGGNVDFECQQQSKYKPVCYIPSPPDLQATHAQAIAGPLSAVADALPP
jgi:hypothetical protein